MRDIPIRGQTLLPYSRFVSELTTRKSPALVEAQAMYAACVAGGIPAETMLAQFICESGAGTAGICKTYNTKSIGNVRAPEKAGSGTLVHTPQGDYATYSTWTAGVVDWIARLLGPKYAGAGLTTLRQVLPKYAPSSDSNDPTAYGDRLIALLDGWGVTPKESAMIPRPQMTIDHTKAKFGGYTRGTRQQRMICSHITGGTNSLSWLRDAHLDAQGDDISPSVNYLIQQTGQIIEIVDPHGPAAWANGIDYGQFPQGKKPNMANPIIAELTNGKISPNQYTISIEHEGDHGTDMTAAQWVSTLALQAWLCQEFNITPDPIHIIGHFEIDGIDRPYCPGWTGDQWDKLQAGIRGLLAGGSATKVPITPPPVVIPPKPIVPSGPDTISQALLAWYHQQTTSLQGSLDNAAFYEATIDFSSIYPTIQGPQRAIVGEYIAAWFMPNGVVTPIFPADRVKLLASGNVKRR